MAQNVSEIVIKIEGLFSFDLIIEAFAFMLNYILISRVHQLFEFQLEHSNKSNPWCTAQSANKVRKNCL